ncbi:hypothetical protein WR25_04082 [Diploscapter pachys]|uniref:Uncharacterized protein n=1 Tax=Diploscapter pachys TaxID=2018661 RepID=A0A2A2J5R5_9BILA|nr:hypothetical protein WR25_04082 [Diploscapter pachys]
MSAASRDDVLEGPISSKAFQYADLNIRHSGNSEKTLSLVKRAIRMGYDCVAINIDVGDISVTDEMNRLNLSELDASASTEEPPTKKKKRGKKNLTESLNRIPSPFLVDESQLDLSGFEKSGKRFRQYSRLTFTLSDPDILTQIFISKHTKSFDLIAVRPANEAILTSISKKSDLIDIITYQQADNKISWFGKKKIMQVCQTEGICFELAYASALTDRVDRQRVFSNGRQLIYTLKKKGIVFTSQAESLIDLRAPIDAMNMLQLWEVGSDDARQFISGYPKQLLQRAESKRTLRGIVHSTPIVEDRQNGEITAKVPSKNLKESAALKRLLSVKHFKLQVEAAPPKEKQGDEHMEE